MTARDEPTPPPPKPPPPTRELLLAQALDACIKAERRRRGSSEELIGRAPGWAKAELRRLVALAGSIEATVAEASPSAEFRDSARARLLHRIGADMGSEEPFEWLRVAGPRLSSLPSPNWTRRTASRRKLPWLLRGSAGLVAAMLTVVATLTASASALPGDPLYGLKQAQEEFGVRLAADDQERAIALLQRADARLDETARLLEQGRTSDAAETTVRFDQVVQRATTTYVITIEGGPDEATGMARMDTRLSRQQERLQDILQSAPEPVRAELRQALVATERSRNLVADPRPVERALGRGTVARPAVAAAPAPTVAAEDLATVVPTRSPTVVATPAPAPAPAMVVIANAPGNEVPPAGIVARADGDGTAQVGGQESNARSGDRGSKPAGAAPQSARPAAVQEQPRKEVVTAPIVAGRSVGAEGVAEGAETVAIDRTGLARRDAAAERGAVGRDVEGERGGAGRDAEAERAVVDRDVGAEPGGEVAVRPAGRGAAAQPPTAGHGQDEGAPEPVVAQAPARTDGRIGARPAGPGGEIVSAGQGRSAPPKVGAQPEREPDQSGREGGDTGVTAPGVSQPVTQPAATPAATSTSRRGGEPARPNPENNHDKPAAPENPSRPGNQPSHDGPAAPESPSKPAGDDSR